MFAKLKRPVTIGFYRLRKATLQAEGSRGARSPSSSSSFAVSASPLLLVEREAQAAPIRAVASLLGRGEGGGGGGMFGGGGASSMASPESQPRVLRVDGCPDADCNGAYTIQPHRVVNGVARYLKNHCE